MVFLDLESSVTSGSIFKEEKLENIASLLAIRDSSNAIRESFSQSITYVPNKGNFGTIFVLGETVYEYQLIDWSKMISCFENHHQWDLAFTILEQLYRGEEKRLLEDQGADVLVLFNDLTESYLDYSLGNAIKSKTIWIDFVYRAVYYSGFFDKQEVVINKIRETSFVNNLGHEFFFCLYHLIESKVIRVIDTQLLLGVVRYFNESKYPNSDVRHFI